MKTLLEDARTNLPALDPHIKDIMTFSLQGGQEEPGKYTLIFKTVQKRAFRPYFIRPHM